jgi:hypothetical protein
MVLDVEQSLHDTERELARSHAAHAATQAALERREAGLAAAQEEAAGARAQTAAEEGRVRELQAALAEQRGEEVGTRREGYLTEVCSVQMLMMEIVTSCCLTVVLNVYAASIDVMCLLTM